MPTHALTMGIASIMQAQHIVLVATGLGKADAVRRMIEGPVDPMVPASIPANAPPCNDPARRGRSFAAEEIGEKSMILYFTGTGQQPVCCAADCRSVWAMKHIASMTKSGRRTRAPDEGGTVLIVVAPTYAWRLPRIVVEWLIKTPFPDTKEAWFVSELRRRNRRGGEI